MEGFWKGVLASAASEASEVMAELDVQRSKTLVFGRNTVSLLSFDGGSRIKSGR